MPAPLILCYHAVSDAWPTPLAVRPRTLQAQVRHLQRRGYTATTFTRAVLDPPAKRVFAVTFDDAYRSVMRLAAPVLDAAGVPATVFVPTRFIGSEVPMSWPGDGGWSNGPHASELIPMSWAELESVAERGWEIGSHTVSHPKLPELDPDAARDELVASKIECERRLGAECSSVAYPFGAHDAAVAELAREAGYAAAAGVRPLGDPRDPLRRTRVGIYRGDGAARFALKIAPSVRRVRDRRAAV